MLRRIRDRWWRVPMITVCQLLVLQAAWGQGPQTGTPRLKIVVVQGEGFRNVVQQITPRPLIVRVEDANNRPVAGATVVFTAPESGPGGEFANDSRTVRVTTTSDGTAVAGVYHPNSNTGPYQIRITAEYQGETASAVISQANIPEKKGHGKLIATVAIIAAAAGAAVAFHSKDNSSSSSNTPTITFGGSAVGAPR